METIDIGGVFVWYNFVIGVLIMLSSEKLGAYAGHFSHSYKEKLTRYTRVSTFAFGASVAVLAGSIQILFYWLRLGV